MQSKRHSAEELIMVSTNLYHIGITLL